MHQYQQEVLRQEPTAAYTASGTSLTLTSATTSSDDMYCVYLGKAVQTVNPPNSSVGNSQLDVSAINSQTAETSIAGGDEVLIYDTSASALRKMTRTNFVSGVGGENKYEFFAHQNTSHTVGNNTFTTIQFDSEFFDSDGKYSTSTYTYSPGEAGLYHVGFSLGINSSTSYAIQVAVLIKNASTELARVRRPHRNHDAIQNYQASTIVELGASDTLKVQSYQNSGSNRNTYNSSSDTYFWGYKLIT
jgi:hypothetical protein